MAVLWILGEAKSGKSELGEEILARLPGTKFYIGTLPRTPENMETIRKHVEQRPRDWQLLEISDELDAAVESIRRGRESGVVGTILDGSGVYVTHRAGLWGEANASPSMADETQFVEQIYSEYGRLVSVCDYLVVVDHVSAQTPTCADYESDPVAWRLRAFTTRCIAQADKVIYHDAEDVSNEDESYVKRIAGEMLARRSGSEVEGA